MIISLTTLYQVVFYVVLTISQFTVESNGLPQGIATTQRKQTLLIDILVPVPSEKFHSSNSVISPTITNVKIITTEVNQNNNSDNNTPRNSDDNNIDNSFKGVANEDRPNNSSSSRNIANESNKRIGDNKEINPDPVSEARSVITTESVPTTDVPPGTSEPNSSDFNCQNELKPGAINPNVLVPCRCPPSQDQLTKQINNNIVTTTNISRDNKMGFPLRLDLESRIRRYELTLIALQDLKCPAASTKLKPKLDSLTALRDTTKTPPEKLDQILKGLKGLNDVPI